MKSNNYIIGVMCLSLGLMLFSCSGYRNIYPVIGPKHRHTFKCETGKTIILVFSGGFKDDAVTVFKNDTIAFNEVITTSPKNRHVEKMVIIREFLEKVHFSINKKNYAIHTKKGYCYIYVHKGPLGLSFVMYPGSLGPYM